MCTLTTSCKSYICAHPRTACPMPIESSSPFLVGFGAGSHTLNYARTFLYLAQGFWATYSSFPLRISITQETEQQLEALSTQNHVHVSAKVKLLSFKCELHSPTGSPPPAPPCPPCPEHVIFRRSHITWAIAYLLFLCSFTPLFYFAMT